METIQIDVYTDRVVFNKQSIPRPSHVPISEWTDFWEMVKRNQQR